MKAERSELTIEFAGHSLILLAQGACYWKAQRTLIVSDLHLEKGSYLASQGHPIPMYDTHDTLLRLEKIINEYKPQTVVCLGDNIHDINAFYRMQPEDAKQVENLCTSVSSWQWIIGNHDKEPFQSRSSSSAQFHTQLNILSLCLTHDFLPQEAFQIIGHYHPKITIVKNGMRLREKCFSISENVLIMPSFGSYTGGLDINHAAYKNVLKAPARHYMLYRDKIWWVK